MSEVLFNIIIGIITWVICEIIKCLAIKIINRLKNIADETPTDLNRYTKAFTKRLVNQYYISLAINIAMFIMLSKTNWTNEFFHVFVIVMFWMSIFVTWCSFECMHDTVKYLRNNFTDDNSDNNQSDM